VHHESPTWLSFKLISQFIRFTSALLSREFSLHLIVAHQHDHIPPIFALHIYPATAHPSRLVQKLSKVYIVPTRTFHAQERRPMNYPLPSTC
jgi:hypothetical protein